MKTNNPINNKKVPGLINIPKTGRSSDNSAVTTTLKNFWYCPTTSQYDWGRIINTDNAAIQFPPNSNITSV